MSSYLHTGGAAPDTLLRNTNGYIEKLSLWIKIKQKNLETRIDHALLAYVSYERRGVVTAHFRQESRYPDRIGLIYLQGFEITALTAPSQA